MKIIIFTPNYPRKSAEMNGVFIHQQVKALSEMGCECHILLDYNWYPPLFLHKLHPYWREGYLVKNNYFDEYEGVKIHQVPVFIKMPNRLFPENFYDRTARAFSNYILKNPALKDADWIYGHFLTDYGHIATKVKLLTGIKCATIARGDDIHAWPAQNSKLIAIVQETIVNSDLVFANSQRLALDAKEFIPNSNKLIQVIYNGIDTQKFQPSSKTYKQEYKRQFGLDSRNNYLLCVATPVASKGWILLFDAIEKLKKSLRNWKLACVYIKRDFSDAIDFLEEIRNREIGEYVQLLGQVEHSKLPSLYNAVDAFILPSDNEGMANAVLEAAATNLPLIITDVGGHKEIFENSNSTILIEPKNLTQLVSALEEFINKPDNDVADTRDRVLQIGTYNDNAEQLIELLENYSLIPSER